MPPAGHALWAEFGGGITFVTSGRTLNVIHKVLCITGSQFFEVFYMGAINASLRRDSPVSMVILHVWFIGIRGHLGEIAGKNKIRPLFLLFWFFCLVEILLSVFGG